MAEVKTMPEPARQTARRRRSMKNRIEPLDIVIVAILGVFALLIVIPFINVLAISFVTQQEYLKTSILLFPKEITLENYQQMFIDGRIWTGYRTTAILLLIGVPINLFLTTSMAYGLSRPDYPFRRFFIFFVVITMMFNGGIIPMYLLMKQLHLINSLWSVVFAYGINAFYLIIMMNYFSNLPIALSESAKLDGAGEWTIMLRIYSAAFHADHGDDDAVLRGGPVERVVQRDDFHPQRPSHRPAARAPVDRHRLADQPAAQCVEHPDGQTVHGRDENGRRHRLDAPDHVRLPAPAAHFIKGMLIGAIKA
jgi:ABC-type sulfate transport system permease component